MTILALTLGSVSQGRKPVGMPGREWGAVLETAGTEPKVSQLKQLPTDYNERKILLERFGQERLTTWEMIEAGSLVLGAPLVLVALVMAWTQLPHALTILGGAAALLALSTVMKLRLKAEKKMVERGEAAGYNIREAL